MGEKAAVRLAVQRQLEVPAGQPEPVAEQVDHHIQELDEVEEMSLDDLKRLRGEL